MKRVPYEVMVNEFERVLTKYGFEPKDAKASAELFAQNSMAGVYSHGLNRFPRVVDYLKKGEIDPKVKAEKIMGFGAFERWDGHRGFGPLNAKLAMDRAVELAKEFGMGIVALGNNNHWMRGALDEMGSSGVPSQVICAIRDGIDCNIYFSGKAVSEPAMFLIVAGSVLVVTAIYILINALCRPRYGDR